MIPFGQCTQASVLTILDQNMALKRIDPPASKLLETVGDILGIFAGTVGSAPCACRKRTPLSSSKKKKKVRSPRAREHHPTGQTTTAHHGASALFACTTDHAIDAGCSFNAPLREAHRRYKEERRAARVGCAGVFGQCSARGPFDGTQCAADS